MTENESTEEGVVFDPFTAPAALKTVVLAAVYTDADGVEHKADKTLELDRDVADDLLHRGLARTVKLDEQLRAERAPAGGSAEAILAAVGDDKDKAKVALEAELAGKKRKSLVSALEAIVNHNPEGA